MVMNRIWVGMFLIATIVALSKLIFWQDTMIFKQMVDALFESAKTGFDLALFLTGALCLWMGFMKIGEDGGAIRVLSRLVSPLFSRLFPEVPKDHPAVGSIMMNFSANMLGLDNAATPLGLKAMNSLQELNPQKDTASNAQIMFLVLNTSGLTIIPVSILSYRAMNNSANATEVFLPILFATFFSTLVGLTIVSIKQKINLLQPVVLAYLGSFFALIVGLLIYLIYFPEHKELVANVGGNVLLFSFIILFILLGVRSKINVYESFIEGAKGGFQIAVGIIPYLIVILAAVAVFRGSGAFEAIMTGIRESLIFIGVQCVEFVEALPVAFMKPLSGGGARGLMLDIFNTHGVDSFAGKLAATFQGSTETTFYVLAVYFGSVGIKKSRYAVTAGLLADLAGIIAAIAISFIFYQSC
jgi:spore maturation protein SpmA